LDSAAAHRIALMGISVGSSVAFVAAADPRINTDVRALVFFGGYHDIVDYLASLATGMSSFNNRTLDWHPSPEALRHAREILHAANARGLAQAFVAAAQARAPGEAEALLRSAPERELGRLRNVSPSEHIDTFKARIFILHDKGDDFVPYFESAKLNQDLPSKVEKTYLITDLFEHVQLQRDITLSTVRDFVRLYGFLYEIIGYL
jgi:pimeloyl-ACP methyl ester carboxylesterase